LTHSSQTRVLKYDPRWSSDRQRTTGRSSRRARGSGAACAHPLCRRLRGGVPVYRRLKPAWFELALSPLRQAWRLGGLHRASPVLFRGSCFTTGLHPPVATPQRRIACLYKRWSYWVSTRFAHSIHALRGALSAPVLSTDARKPTSAARGGPPHLSTDRNSAKLRRSHRPRRVRTDVWMVSPSGPKAYNRRRNSAFCRSADLCRTTAPRIRLFEGAKLISVGRNSSRDQP
jgi:hypothetical protein